VREIHTTCIFIAELAVFFVVDDGVISVTPVVSGNPAFDNSVLTAVLKAVASSCVGCPEVVVYSNSASIPVVDNFLAPSFSRREQPNFLRVGSFDSVAPDICCLNAVLNASVPFLFARTSSAFVQLIAAWIDAL